MMKLVALVFGATVLMSAAASADPGQNAGNGGHEYVLLDGTTHDTPGEMFQYLRTRDNGFAAGNPKDIVEAYPESFENVGDLVDQKRTDEE